MAEQLDEKKLAEKKKALENAIASIDKQFGKGAVMKLGDNVGPPGRSDWIWRLG